MSKTFNRDHPIDVPTSAVPDEDDTSDGGTAYSIESDPDPNFPPPLSAEGDVLVSAWSDDLDDEEAGEDDVENEEGDDTEVAEAEGEKQEDNDDVGGDTKDNEDVGDEGDDEEDEDDGSERVEIGLAPEGSQSQGKSHHR